MRSKESSGGRAGARERVRGYWRAMPPRRKLYVSMMGSLLLLMSGIAVGAVWLACDGVRIVANVEDDAILYKIFAGMIVVMAVIFGAAAWFGHFIIAGFSKKIDDGRTAREQMSRAMYHGIATPIIDVRDKVDMFRLGMCDKDEMCDFVARNCQELLRHVKTKADISKNIGGVSIAEPDELNLAKAVRAAAEMHLTAAETRGVSLSLDGIPGVLRAVAYEDRINMLVENLVGNAVKYTPRGGRVEVSLKVERPGRFARILRRFAFCPPSENVVIVVSDTGIGIGKHDMERIYDESYRGEDAKAMASGDGEGLALVHAIVVSFYKGTIKCKSKLGAGTTFTVTLPLRVL